jgi:hypothetical protein
VSNDSGLVDQFSYFMQQLVSKNGTFLSPCISMLTRCFTKRVDKLFPKQDPGISSPTTAEEQQEQDETRYLVRRPSLTAHAHTTTAAATTTDTDTTSPTTKITTTAAVRTPHNTRHRMLIRSLVPSFVFPC